MQNDANENTDNNENIKDKIILIDGNSIINRAFYGMPVLTNKDGLHTNAVYGFMNIMFKFIEEEAPKYIAVAFDLKAPTFRHKKYSEYKGNRKKMPDELAEQLPMLKNLLDSFNIKMYSLEGYEADDILGTMAKKLESEKITPVIVSGDRDMLQIASEIIKIRIPKTKGGKTETEDYYQNDVIEKYGVTPTEFISVKALMGDASDNIPGVAGIGEKTAIKIIQQFKSVENAIENCDSVMPKKASENLASNKEIALISKELATIDIDVPININIDECEMNELVSEAAYNELSKLGFKSIIERIKKNGNSLSDISSSKKKKSNAAIVYSEPEPMLPPINENAIDQGLIEYVKVDNVKDLDDLIDYLNEQKFVSYNIHIEKGHLLGLGICFEGKKAYFIEPSINLNEVLVVNKLKQVFESNEINKVTHDIKYSLKFFRAHGIKPNSLIFDTMIAAYLINPSKSNYTFDSIAFDYLSESYPSEQIVLGKGKSKISIKQLDDAVRTEYIACQANITFRLYDILNKQISFFDQNELYYNIEHPLIFILDEMENIGIRIDVNVLKNIGIKIEKRIDELTDEIYKDADTTFNINSTKQLGEILFEKLGLKPTKKTKTGYSTDVDALEFLRGDHPVIDKLMEYRTLSKLKSTYIDGLISVTNKKTGLINTTFNQTIAATGRLSSTEPNLQNIPIKLDIGRELRKAFIPHSDEYVFLDADYSQIELRVLAHISGDEVLINAFKSGQDIHRLTASQVYNTPFELVTNRQRSNAKAVNFGIVYGISAFSLSKDLGITRKEAEKYIESYFKTYPNVKIYLDNVISEAAKTTYAKTIYNRHRPMPELKSPNYNIRSFGERVAMNMPIQGTAADIIKVAMVKVYNILNNNKLKSRMILQVHDELLLLAHKDEIEIVKNILKENMENAAKLLVPLEVDIHMGETWFHAK